MDSLYNCIVFIVHGCLLAPLFLINHVVHSVSVRGERWSAPCRGSTDVFSTFWVMDLLRHGDSDQVVAHKLWLEANDIIFVATALRDLYDTLIIKKVPTRQEKGPIKKEITAEHRIQSEDLQDYLDDNITIAGFPDTRALNPNTNLPDRLQEDYRRASIVAVFVQQIRMDEQVSNLTPNYQRLVETLEAQLYPFLCQLHIAISDRTSRPISYVTSDVMVDSDRNVSNTAMRYCRDYRLLKDTVELMTSIRSDYDVIRQDEAIEVVEMEVKKSTPS